MPDDPEKEPSLMSGFAQAMTLSAELVATTAVGTGLGWLADRWLGTLPFLTVLGAVLGGTGGITRVWRSWKAKM
jgi:ATP synthase protein I